MMKRKLLALISCALLVTTMLAGCGKKVECDFCCEERKCTTIKFLGEELYICKDCREEFNEMFG